MRRRELIALLGSLLVAQTAFADSVALSLTPSAPVKGRDVTARLEIKLDTERPAPPVLRANVGTIEAVTRVGPGRFSARYVLPTTRFPEVAIIVAFAPWPHPQSTEGAFGVLRVPIASAVEVPGRAERGATVTLSIGGVTFGPVTASEQGAFTLPLVVLPGFGVAQSITRDRVGNKRTSSIDLALPPTDQLACVVTPTQVPADGTSKARVLCASSDRYGSPSKAARVNWKGGRGVLGPPRDLGNGVQEWTWTAPAEPGSGEERLTATWKQGSVDSSEEVVVGLTPGAVQRVTFEAFDEVAHQGSRWLATVKAVDRSGRALSDVSIQSPAGVALTDARGLAALAWPVTSQDALGARTVRVVAYGPAGREPASVRAFRSDAGVGVWVTDLAGLPVAGQRVVAGTSAVTTDEQGLGSFPQVSMGELHHGDWPGLSVVLDGGLEAVRPEVAATAEILIAPPVPVNVRVEREGAGVTWWVESSTGVVLDGRRVELRDGSGARQLVSGGRSAAQVARGVVSVTDLDSRVSAVIEVTP